VALDADADVEPGRLRDRHEADDEDRAAPSIGACSRA
jgi:hypothetical protein